MNQLFDPSAQATKPSTAKDLEIKRCNVQQATKLNAQWHSRVPHIETSNITRNRYYACFIAEYDGIPYATAIWSTPIAANRIKNGQHALELRRLAICDDAPKFTATRMISQMTKHIKKYFPEITRLISYQDTGSHQGTIYKASNWTATTKSTLTDWTNRDRNTPQTTAEKIRWEYQLRPEKEQIVTQKPTQTKLELLE